MTPAELRNHYVEAFSSESGKIALGDLLRFCGMGTPSHVAGDPCSTAFCEGRKDSVQRIVDFVSETADPVYQAMLKERLLKIRAERDLVSLDSRDR